MQCESSKIEKKIENRDEITEIYTGLTQTIRDNKRILGGYFLVASVVVDVSIFVFVAVSFVDVDVV